MVLAPFFKYSVFWSQATSVSPKLWTCLKILLQASETFYQEAELISTQEQTFSEINFKQEIKNKSSAFSAHV